MQQGWSELGGAAQRENSLGHQADTGRQTEQEKTQSRRTIGEVGEKSAHDSSEIKSSTIRQQARKGGAKHPLGCQFLGFDDSAFHSNHGRVRAILGSQF